MQIRKIKYMTMGTLIPAVGYPFKLLQTSHMDTDYQTEQHLMNMDNFL